MIWDAAIFRLILENRKEIQQRYPVDPPLNVAYHTFIDRCFFQTQASLIRRMVDNYGLRGEKGVFSLIALLKDIKSYKDLLTRGKFFQLRGLPYNDLEIRDKQRKYVADQVRLTPNRFIEIPNELDWEIIVETHNLFDKLSAKNIESRSLNDCIQEDVFILLERKLGVCENIVTYVNKYIAHSATPESRKIENIDIMKIPLKRIWEAHEAIYMVAEFLSTVLFNVSQVPLPREIPDLFYHWEIPSLENLPNERLRSKFKQFRDETDGWMSNGVDQIWEQIRR